MTAAAMEKALTHYSAKMRNDKETAKVRENQNSTTRNNGGDKEKTQNILHRIACHRIVEK